MARDENEQRDRTPLAEETPLTKEQAGSLFARMNEVIRAGEEMRKLRAEMIRALAHLGWTQDTIARLTEMTQPAVSKQMTKSRQVAKSRQTAKSPHTANVETGDPSPPVELSLEQHDIPWLEGRLWGLAEEIAESAETRDENTHCARHLNAIARGKHRFTPHVVDELRRLVEADLREHQAELPSGYRAAYDKISRGLDAPSTGAAATTSGATPPAGAGATTSGATPPAGAAAAMSASARRGLARQLQRAHLQGSQ